MRRIGLVLAGWMACVALLGASAAPSQDSWSRPAATLANRVAGILGPGPVQFTLRNLSSLSAADVATIQRLLRQDLQSHGIVFAGPDSANILRITLSENSHERLWVAEVVEGTDTKVVMVSLPAAAPAAVPAPAGLTLRMQPVFTTTDPVLSILQTPNGLIVLQPEQIVVETSTPDGWHISQQTSLPQNRTLSRDPQGLLTPSANGQGFLAVTGGAACQGTYTAGLTSGEWSITCHSSDDPWPLFQPTGSSAPLKAFFNAARNYFTGIVTPSLGIDLPPFYSAAMLPRPVGDAALLLTGIDGKVQLVQNGALQNVAGTRDWGSDIAALRSGCGTGTQILASGSGQALNDSLRAYSLPALEAVPASAPLAMGGTVMALSSAPDGSSVLAIVRTPTNQYEVDRVTALCN